jgi:hypothetical protein
MLDEDHQDAADRKGNIVDAVHEQDIAEGIDGDGDIGGRGTPERAL